ncbi:MAG TPA: HipA domain-containing protein [Pirellulales bacterium]
MDTIKDEPIRQLSEFQQNWASLIRPLRRNRYCVEAADSIGGDAPKSFIRMQEYTPEQPGRAKRFWPYFIAKVGSKSYPNESITEHLLTRVGEAFGVRMASTQLRVVGTQVRVLSKYFLRRGAESLVHGIEVFKQYLDEEMVAAIAASRQEQVFYTFQTVVAAIKHAFPDHAGAILPGLVAMLAFDAIVGNNDRHPANWGVIVPVAKRPSPRFSPVYDTARGMFWNVSEAQVARILAEPVMLSAYIERSIPQIGWDGDESKVGHFELVSGIYQDFAGFRGVLDKLAEREPLALCGRLIEEEFRHLMTDARRELILRCLKSRHDRYLAAIS